MDNDRIKGAAKEVKGAIKETAGKLTGNRQTEIEGKAEKAVGKVQRNVGEARTRSATRWTRSRKDARQPVLVLRTDRSSPIMKHYRNAALGLALALGAALAPVHAQGTTMSQDQIDARYDAAKSNATPAAATPRIFA